MILRYRHQRDVLAGFVASISLAIFMFFLPSKIEASVITIDTSQYSIGTDLSNVSPFVTLQDLDGTYGSYPLEKRSNGFGAFELGWTRCVGRYECAMGFGMAFKQAPRWVSLSGTFNNAVLAPSRSLSWRAFDKFGDLIAQGHMKTAGNEPGQFFTQNVAVPNMMSLVVGGADLPSPANYERLSFAVGVPEPAPFAMLAVGLGGIALLRRRKHSKAERVGSAG